MSLMMPGMTALMVRRFDFLSCAKRCSRSSPAPTLRACPILVAPLAECNSSGLPKARYMKGVSLKFEILPVLQSLMLSNFKFQA